MTAKGSPGWKRVAESASFGFVFGALFPIVSTAIALLSNELEPSWASVVVVHSREPLLQVIDAVPFLLLLTFAVVGRGRADLDAMIEGLEVRVAQRTSILEKASRAVQRDARNRGRLLGRVADSMCGKIEKIVSCPRDERGEWAWESVMDIATRVRDLSRFEGDEVWQQSESFNPTTLVQGVRDHVKESPTIDSTIDVSLDANVPENMVGNVGLMEAALKLAVELTAGLAPEGTTTVRILSRQGAPGSRARLYMECRNAHARSPDASVSKIAAEPSPGVADEDPLRELLGVTLRTYVKALDAELLLKTSREDGTVVSLSVPLEAPSDA